MNGMETGLSRKPHDETDEKPERQTGPRHAWLRHLTIRTKVMLPMLLFILIVSVLLLLVIRAVAVNVIERNLYDYLEVTQKETGKSLELVIDGVNMATVRLMTDNNLIQLLSSNVRFSSAREAIFRTLVKADIEGESAITDVLFYGPDGEVLRLAGENAPPGPEAAYRTAISGTKSLIVWGRTVRDEAGTGHIPMGKRFRNLYTGQSLGVMVVYLRESVFEDICGTVVPDLGYSFLLNEDDSILSHPESRRLGSTVYETALFQSGSGFRVTDAVVGGMNSLIAVSPLDDSLNRFDASFRMVSLVDRNRLFAVVPVINRYVLIIIAIMSLLAMIVSRRVASSVTGPISRLREKLDAFGRNNAISLSFFNEPRDELWSLEETYNGMIRRIGELVHRMDEEKEVQRELELTALQAQINPHFLYNTLDAIGWIAKIRKQSDIELLVLSLARFFRIGLHKGDKYITLQEELDLVSSFVSVEQFRFPDRFKLEIDVDEDILSCPMPKIILQPLVENAIKHGISEKAEAGLIRITGHREGRMLALAVMDDGAGFDLSMKPQPRTLGGYGLKNVDERLRLEYGPGFGLRIESIPGEGTTVSIRMPDELPGATERRR